MPSGVSTLSPNGLVDESEEQLERIVLDTLAEGKSLHLNA